LIVTAWLQFLHSHSHAILPLEKVRRRWEDNMKIVLEEIRCNSMGWIHVVQYRDMEGLCALMNAVCWMTMNVRLGEWELALAFAFQTELNFVFC
jgi:Fic family protein